jgi:hypothetical protein
MKEIEFAAVVKTPKGKRVHWARTHLSYWSRCGTVGTTLCERTCSLGTVAKTDERKWCRECERVLIQEFRERKLI